LNGLGMQSPLLAACILVLMLSLIGIPPFAGFFGKLYMFMEALNQGPAETRLTLMGLVALGLFNSVVSAFYYVRVLKAMYLREPGAKRLGEADKSIAIPIVIGTLMVVAFGVYPKPLIEVMQAASEPMLTSTGGWASMVSPPSGTGYAPMPPSLTKPAAAPAVVSLDPATAKNYEQLMKKSRQTMSPAGQPKGAPAKKAETQGKTP
jgi:formate hydrogenlyase subunit 3/multisubunit Na+/H+ antiporter MnhD subunit